MWLCSAEASYIQTEVRRWERAFPGMLSQGSSQAPLDRCFIAVQLQNAPCMFPVFICTLDCGRGETAFAVLREGFSHR